MATAIAARRPASQHTTLLARLLDRCARLLPYMALPGYYPLSHAYHFRPKSESVPRKKITRLPAAPFHR